MPSNRFTFFTRAAVATMLAGSVLATATAAPLTLDAAHSSVAAVFKQMNVPVESNFKRFNAALDYDAAHPDKATARVDIDIASFDLGSAQYNQEVAKKEWFNASQFPKASFVSSSIKPAGAGKLNVVGKLTIKGKTQDVHFPLTVKTDAGKQVFDGQLPIKRLAFNIGEGEWKDTDMVADDVVIKFHLTAK